MTTRDGGQSRRKVLECMTWAGTGVLWTVTGGVPSAVGLIDEAVAQDVKGFTFLQIGLAGAIPRGAGAARGQRSDLPRDRRHDRRADRHGDVSARARTRLAAAGFGRRTAQGFTLVGGRLDFLDGKPVAALVYRRRAHVINVFVGQGLGAAPPSPKLQVMQGFNILRWRDGGLSLVAVSDLNTQELEEFGAKFAAAEKAG